MLIFARKWKIIYKERNSGPMNPIKPVVKKMGYI
jgi:hypothetical protein